MTWPIEKGRDAERKLELLWKLLQQKKEAHDLTEKMTCTKLKENASRFLDAVTKASGYNDCESIVEKEIQSLIDWLRSEQWLRGIRMETFDFRVAFQMKLPEEKVEDDKEEP